MYVMYIAVSRVLTHSNVFLERACGLRLRLPVLILSLLLLSLESCPFRALSFLVVDIDEKWVPSPDFFGAKNYYASFASLVVLLYSSVSAVPCLKRAKKMVELAVSLLFFSLQLLRFFTLYRIVTVQQYRDERVFFFGEGGGSDFGKRDVA